VTEEAHVVKVTNYAVIV